MIFSKLNGLGNDFVITDDRENKYTENLDEMARKLCHRRTGIGTALFSCAKAKHAMCACKYSTATAARPKCAATA